jgi:Protein of unknown function (DUF1571)
MAIPMSGPVVLMNRTTSQGRRRLFLALAGLTALTGAMWMEVWGTRAHPLAHPSGLGGAGAPTEEEVVSPQPAAPAAAVLDASQRVAAAHSAGDDGLAIESYIALKPVVSENPDADSCDLRGAPIARAITAIKECQARYQTVRDYTCTFSKRERINGRLTPLHVLTMKVRTQPRSIYLRFRQPAAGREAIYIAGQNDGKLLAHDVGLNKLLAGTLRLEPTGSRAMEDNRHPITEAGIGPLLDTLETRWSAELGPSESVVVIRDDEKVENRRCTMIETTHPCRQSEFLFYRVRLFIDEQLGLPIHFEAYDWPRSPREPADLMEEYTYKDIKLNVGLSDRDFDVSNADYAFGRF